MLDNLCIIFMTAYFGYDGGYHPVPKETKRIEIKTKEFRTLLFKVDEHKWFGIVNGKIFYSDLNNFTKRLCQLADEEPLPEVAYKPYSVFVK